MQCRKTGLALLVLVLVQSVPDVASVAASADEAVPSGDGAAAPPPNREDMTPPWETVGKTPPDTQAPPQATQGDPAQPNPRAKGTMRAQESTVDHLNKVFINIGTGFGYVSYDPYYSAISSSQVYSNGQGYPIASDEGFYLGLIGPNTLTGIAAHAVTDLHLGSTSTYGYSTTTTNPFIFQGNLSASLMQFFGSEQASGFYVRADAGYAVVGIGSGTNFFSLSGTSSGVGLLGGLGYAFPLGKHVRLLFGGQASTIVFLPDSPLSTFQGSFSVLIGF